MEKDEVKKLGSSEVLNLITSILPLSNFVRLETIAIFTT
jgi:hypothetical protein